MSCFGDGLGLFQRIEPVANNALKLGLAVKAGHRDRSFAAPQATRDFVHEGSFCALTDVGSQGSIGTATTIAT